MSQSSGGIGYNITQAKSLIAEVKQGYKDMTNKMQDGWATVSNDMNTKWVSINSEKYEKTLAQHLADTHLTAGNILNELIGIFIVSVNHYIDSEVGTTLTKDGQEVTTDFDLASYKLDVADSQLRIDYSGDNENFKSVVKAAQRNFGEGTDFKIEDANVAQTLYSTIESYVNDVKAQVTNSYSGLSSASAFPGDVQQGTLDNLIANVTAQVEKLSTYLADLESVLEEMVGVIKTAQEEVSSTASSAADSIANASIF